MNSEYVSFFYKNLYGSTLGPYEFAGKSLADKFKDGDVILDIGCGNNEFKSDRYDLIGIDPYNKNADLMIFFDDYVPDRMFDVVLCLGVFHWCDDEFLDRQLKKINSCLKPGGRIYWRNHPTDTGIQNIDETAKREVSEFTSTYYEWLKENNLSQNDPDNCFNLYPWNIHTHQTLSTKYGYSIVDLRYDYDKFNDLYKIFAEWIKL